MLVDLLESQGFDYEFPESTLAGMYKQNLAASGA